jgi:putative addiction module component (TIGR02574 family)
MAIPSITELLSLPAKDRAELAMMLWSSLTEDERQAQLSLTDEEAAELDRRWAEHLKNPSSAVLWVEVRQKLFHRQ